LRAWGTTTVIASRVRKKKKATKKSGSGKRKRIALKGWQQSVYKDTLDKTWKIQKQKKLRKATEFKLNYVSRGREGKNRVPKVGGVTKIEMIC